jgi:hypothetical protein
MIFAPRSGQRSSRNRLGVTVRVRLGGVRLR